MNSVSGLHCRWLLMNEFCFWPQSPLITHEWILFLASIAPGYSWMNAVSGLHRPWLLMNEFCFWPPLPLVIQECILSLASIAPAYSRVNTLSGHHCPWLLMSEYSLASIAAGYIMNEYSLWPPLSLFAQLWVLPVASIAPAYSSVKECPPSGSHRPSFLLSWHTDFSRHNKVFFPFCVFSSHSCG